MSNNQALKELQAAESQKGGSNIIYLCEPHKLPELHRLIVETVHLSEDPKAGDIYYHGLSKKWGLHHQAKLKLALAAAIEWDTLETKPVTLQRDYVHFQAVGQIRREYGRVIRFRGDYEFDLESLKEDLFDEYSKKADDNIKEGKLNKEYKETWVRDKVKRDYSQKRQHRLKLAATGAKSVVIDKLLNLKAGYPSKQAAAGPFVIVRCQLAPDLENPDMRARLSMMALQSVAGVFGQRQLPDPGGQIVDIQPTELSNDVGKQEEGSSTLVPFEESDRQTQIDILNDMAKRKRYDVTGLEVPIEQMGERNRQRFYDHLLTMEDAA